MKKPPQLLTYMMLVALMSMSSLFAQGLKNLIPGSEKEEEEEVVEFLPIEQFDDRIVLNSAPLNTIFQFLAEEAEKQYFHNASLAAPTYNVTGNLNIGDPIQQMKELAFMHGIKIYEKGDTVYAFTSAELDRIPYEEWHYQLRYLRPDDIDQVKLLLRPFLSNPAGGRSVVNYETKTNTLIVIDREESLKKVREFMARVDKPKEQVSVEVKILRVNSNEGSFSGVDWSNSLGAAGLPISATRSLNQLFNLGEANLESTNTLLSSTTATLANETVESATAGLVLSPAQINGVLRALNEQDLSRELSSPTVITEDNEEAAISIIDRIPIVTTTTTATANGTDTAEEVRYLIDSEDPTITDGADQTREVGITISVVPAMLPDGTIRMKLRPRSAQITEFVQGVNATYPRVTEATVEAIARVPNGHSLIIGGFYGSSLTQNNSAVPLLGRIPGLGMAFKSNQEVEERTSLVFIVTPKKYNPACIGSNHSTYRETYQDLVFREAEAALAGAEARPLLPSPPVKKKVVTQTATPPKKSTTKSIHFTAPDRRKHNHKRR